MDHFHYQDGVLCAESVPLARIAESVGTPFYCYSSATLSHHLAVFRQAFASIDHLICYSVKANSNLAVLNLLVEAGAGVDIVSGGELARAARVNCPPERIVFSGVGKSSAEIRAALYRGLLMFNVESRAELERINRIAGEMGKIAPVSLRINPDVDPKTHPYISTGLRKNKFGIPHAMALDVYQVANTMPHIEIVGLDCHIGSQLTQLDPFVDAVRRVRGLVELLIENGINIRYLDLGGGLGIPYREEEETPSPALYAEALLSELEGLNITLVLEPGRAIAGNAGVLVARVEYVKQGEEKQFIITDAGMNDLMRPALYEAYHTVIPVQLNDSAETSIADVVGPICESGDYFARDRMLPNMAEGDLLAVRSAGAYGFVMSSNYNSRPRPAEVMVRGDDFSVIRERETIESLMAGEQIF
ncbi:MAG: diaminopimelate decarboxylase [Magnetococcales bacterium]|nr:diaminopimelate decarboxylase [Magnetococcales bacterium]